MTKLAFAFSSTAAVLLLAGNTFAATPAAGEAPFFNDAVGASAVQREDVRVTSAAQMPASGEMSSVVVPAADLSILTRAEVREALQAAIDRGIYPDSGEMHSVAASGRADAVTAPAVEREEAMR